MKVTGLVLAVLLFVTVAVASDANDEAEITEFEGSRQARSGPEALDAEAEEERPLRKTKKRAFGRRRQVGRRRVTTTNDGGFGGGAY
ncbi:hypothetical protein V1264_008389 [Littorina saxatilis]|uniref:Uncharacterized protein n=1 Tax=Littorina saxatilis TaxID=31220 RepID=A0AAN9AUB1_9CAEN